MAAFPYNPPFFTLITTMLSPVTQNINTYSQHLFKKKKKLNLKIYVKYVFEVQPRQLLGKHCMRQRRECQKDGLVSIEYVHIKFHLKFDYTYRFLHFWDETA